jgi:hypothetical protein
MENIEFVQIKNLTYFSDKNFFFSSAKDYWVNLVKLIYVIPLFYILNKLSWSFLGKDIVFAPPLIFAILQPSMESFSIFLIVISFIFYRSGNILFALVFGFLATLVDRSMFPGFFMIISLFFFLKIRELLKLQLDLLLVMIILIIFFLSLVVSYNYILNFYNLSAGDIAYVNNFGNNNYLALLASLSGLYGWMSLRPFPWFLYYFIIILFFLLGVLKIDRKKKIEFFLVTCVCVLVMSLFSSFSQARYFPVLIFLFWETILVGFKSIFGRTDFFVYLVMLSTTAGFLFK